MKNFVIFLILISILQTNAFAKRKKKDINELDDGLHEPLFIDLVRPINSKQGDLEINSLCYNDGKKLMCAPEIEYVIADGTAVEFELPMEGRHVKEYKFAFQQRLKPIKKFQHYHHATQLIIQKPVHKNEHVTHKLFYISGVNIKDFSIIAMNGFSNTKNNTQIASNMAFYWNVSQKIAYGVEYNYEHNTRITPQIKWHLPDFEIQIGAGIYGKKPFFATRLIYLI